MALVSSSPLVARADVRPDFDDDAKPILGHQRGLIEYVESNFEVKDTGSAKLPGDDDHRPIPPYIFHARPIGTNGPFNLRLLIQPGPPGHILGVVDITKVHVTEPGNAPAPRTTVANRQPVQHPAISTPAAKASGAPALETATGGPVVTPQPATPAPAEPTADTPSGPIVGNGQTAPSAQPSLEPPPDPAPATH